MTKFNKLAYYKMLILLTTTYLSSTYQIFQLDDDKLCSPYPNRTTITLGANVSSGMIISLNNTQSKLNRHTTEWKTDFVCNFNVSTAPYDGLFAVIQNVAFRKDESTNECVDYVEYRLLDGSASKRYCGQVDTEFATDTDALNLAPLINSFIEPSGTLEVYIHISKKPLKPYRKIELAIAFTSYRYCYDNPFVDDKPCSSKYMVHCIYKGFFNDGYVNCPYPGCVDEKICPRKIYNETKKSASLVVAISLFILLLVIFAFFICYMCRKRKRLCWSEDFNIGRDQCRCSQTVELNETGLHNRATPSAYTISPTVTVVASPEDDRDSLPSYDSLFPPQKQL